MIGFRRTQNITPIGLFYKNMGRLWRGVCLCEDLVGVTWKESDCEDLVGIFHGGDGVGLKLNLYPTWIGLNPKFL